MHSYTCLYSIKTIKKASESPNSAFKPASLPFLTLYEHLDLSSLRRLPEEPGQVEDGALEEEEEADPLVVLVVLELLALVQVADGRDARVREVLLRLADPPGKIVNKNKGVKCKIQ